MAADKICNERCYCTRCIKVAAVKEVGAKILDKTREEVIDGRWKDLDSDGDQEYIQISHRLQRVRDVICTRFAGLMSLVVRIRLTVSDQHNRFVCCVCGVCFEFGYGYVQCLSRPCIAAIEISWSHGVDSII